MKLLKRKNGAEMKETDNTTRKQGKEKQTQRTEKKVENPLGREKGKRSIVNRSLLCH
jgi:hypothetical protein